MKTTIDIPEPLYKQAKIRAVERGETLRQFVVESISRAMEAAPQGAEVKSSLWERRRLLPAFERASKTGAFRPGPGDRDVTVLISEDRDAR